MPPAASFDHRLALYHIVWRAARSSNAEIRHMAFIQSAMIIYELYRADEIGCRIIARVAAARDERMAM